MHSVMVKVFFLWVSSKKKKRMFLPFIDLMPINVALGKSAPSSYGNMCVPSLHHILSYTDF